MENEFERTENVDELEAVAMQSAALEKVVARMKQEQKQREEYQQYLHGKFE